MSTIVTAIKSQVPEVSQQETSKVKMRAQEITTKERIEHQIYKLAKNPSRLIDTYIRSSGYIPEKIPHYLVDPVLKYWESTAHTASYYTAKAVFEQAKRILFRSKFTLIKITGKLSKVLELINQIHPQVIQVDLPSKVFISPSGTGHKRESIIIPGFSFTIIKLPGACKEGDLEQKLFRIFQSSTNGYNLKSYMKKNRPLNYTKRELENYIFPPLESFLEQKNIWTKTECGYLKSLTGYPSYDLEGLKPINSPFSPKLQYVITLSISH